MTICRADKQKMFHEAATVAAKAMRDKVAAVEANGRRRTARRWHGR